MLKKWSEKEFQNPPSEFRGAPFWSWNNKLNKEQLLKQIGFFEEMGLGGYHIHCRVGLDTEYLGEEFMDCVKACVEEGKRRNLFTYLYDEDRWPSGTAGGIVTKDDRFRSRHLFFVPSLLEEEKSGDLLRTFRIKIENGYLTEYSVVDPEESGEDIWKLYLRMARKTPWHNNESYVDTLNKQAIERFVEVTHEVYKREVGEEFGKIIPSIFTDEPQFSRKQTLFFAEEKRSLTLPFTESFEDFYKEKYRAGFLDFFPEVVWDLQGGKVSVTRYQYHDCIAELFASSFADTLGNWCKEHQIMLTGHMMEEPTLQSQTCALGEAMRSFRSFQQPGIDMLCDRREYTTAKQAQSAAHQYDCPGVLSELYGVTNWDFDFRGHKLQGDWQAALGVTRRVQHLSWVSMEGEAKRDYPASIFYQSPWYKEYRLVEDHFARVNTALMRGKPHVRIGVIHPVESYWLHFGPSEQTAQQRDALEEQFISLSRWLLFGLLDYDYLAESLLPEQEVHTENKKLCVGSMAYDVILVAGCETLRSTTFSYLSEFINQGGKVIIAGSHPIYQDARPSDAGEKLSAQSTCIGFEKNIILEALKDVRELEIKDASGQPADHFVYQMREEEDYKWLFIANGSTPLTHDIPARAAHRIRIKGNYSITLCDTHTGELHSISTYYQNGDTYFTKVLDWHDSLLLKLEERSSRAECQNDTNILSDKEEKYRVAAQSLDGYMDYKLEEPNVLLLDLCEYRFDDGIWNEREEILRIDNTLRERLGFPKRMEEWPQPWVQKEDENCKFIELKYVIHSQIECKGVSLAMERPEKSVITFNGNIIEPKVTGWYVDESIQTLALGNLKKGENILMIKSPFGKKTNLEWCYLLGDFGVQVAGSYATITELPKKIAFGDYTTQGLPFYAGNLTYLLPFSVKEGDYKLQISKYRAPLLKIAIDSGEEIPLAYAPYEVNLGHLSEGSHQLEITSFGNRVNAFGTVHNCDESTEWYGPNEWRTDKERYSFEYQLRRMGVLKAPMLYQKISDNSSI